MKKRKLWLKEGSGSVVSVKSLNAAHLKGQKLAQTANTQRIVVTFQHMVSIVEIKAKTLRLG